jgi:hypothetical protein
MHPKSITLKIEGKEVVVEKLPLRRIAEVFKALDELPKKIAGLDYQNLTNEKFVEILPGIIGDVLPEVAKIISIGSTLTEEEVLDKYGLAEAIEVIDAIFKVNDFSKVVENVKKLMARKPLTEGSNKPTGSTEPLTS